MKIVIGRLLIGVAALAASYTAAPSAPPVVAMATPVAAAHVVDFIAPHPEWCDCGHALLAPVASKEAAPILYEAQTPYEVFKIALTRSSWPLAEWPVVEDRVACEDTTYDPALTGDGGRAIGYMQIRADAHPDLAARFDLTDPVGNLDAGKIVQDQARAAGLPSPWLRCDAEVGR